MPDVRTYVAAPVAVLRRPDWPEVVNRIERLVGPAWDPAELFCSSSDWLAQWPGFLPLVRDLVLVPDSDGGIGAGCLREIADVLGVDREVRVLINDRLLGWGEVKVRTVNAPSRFCVPLSSGEGGSTNDRHSRNPKYLQQRLPVRCLPRSLTPGPRPTEGCGGNTSL